MNGIAGIQVDLIAPVPGSGERPGERYVVSRDQLADILGLKTVTINALVTDGMPKVQHGRYDLAACVQWYVETWRKRVNERPAMSSSERERYDKARADGAELTLAERQRELIPLTEVRQVMTRVVAITVSALEALPARMAPEVAPLTEPAACQAKLSEAIHDARTDIGAALGDLGAAAPRRRASKAPAKKKRGSVGRRKKAPA